MQTLPNDGGVAGSPEPDYDEDGGDQGEEDKPEPEEDVDFLIDHIDRKHTQRIVFLKDAVRISLWVSLLQYLPQVF